MTIIISRDNADEDSRAAEDALAERIASEARADVLLVPHLYHLPEDAAVWDELRAIDGPLVVFARLYPRPAEWVLRRHGVGGAGLVTFDLRAYAGAEDCLRACSEHLAAGEDHASVRELTCETPARWYPVIDDSRCVNCKHCMEFCLFGVYELNDRDEVRATHPDNCKPGCPACARVCPHGAIMFPLCDVDGAIAGAPGRFPTPDPGAGALLESRKSRSHPEPGVAGDDLDALVDDLDRLAEGQR